MTIQSSGQGPQKVLPLVTTLSPLPPQPAPLCILGRYLGYEVDFSNLAVQIVVFADETDAKTTRCPHSLFIYRELPSFRWVHGYPACHDHTNNFYAIG